MQPSRACGFAALIVLGAILAVGHAPARSAPLYPNYPSETPEKFTPTYYGADYTRREVMIPMRDGVKLRTIILVACTS